MAALNPSITVPIALACFSGEANLAAAVLAAMAKTPLPRASIIRETIRKPKPGRVIVIRLPSTIKTRESINNLRLFIFVVAITTSGDPNALARAKTVMSCPATATET